MRGYDAIVIGAGMAGLAVGAELAATRRVVVLEAEAAPATQSSARSASSWIASYSGPVMRSLTLASRSWFETGGGVMDRPLLSRRGLLLITGEADSAGLAAACAAGMILLDERGARESYPPLRPGVVIAAAYDDDSQDIETPAALEALRRSLVARGGELRVSAPVSAIEGQGSGWQVRTPTGSVSGGTVVNAAGAWADQVAQLAGVPPVGLRAFRRTACLIGSQAGSSPMALPLLMEADEAFYVKPESGRLLASPADEIEQAPGPAEPRDEDVALGLERVAAHTTLATNAVEARWAGLRTFSPDRDPVLGPDPEAPGFAWYAGVGGSGIMTAPAAARSVVSLLDEGDLPADVIGFGGDAALVRPERFRGS